MTTDLQDKTNNITSLNAKMSLTGITVDVYKFLEKDSDHTFAGWKARLPKKLDNKSNVPSGKEEVCA